MTKSNATPTRATAVRGVQRIIDAGGDVSYKAQVRRKGHPAEAKRFASLDEAARWKRAREAEIDRGGVVVDRRETAKYTLAALFKKYRLEISPTKRGRAVEEARLQSSQAVRLCRICCLAGGRALNL